MTKASTENTVTQVLMICPFSRPNLGGVESHLVKLISYLGKQKVYVHLVTYQPLTTAVKTLGIERGNNYTIYRISWFGQGLFPKVESNFPLTFLYLVPGLFFGSLYVYFRYLKNVDVIHAHGFSAAFVTKFLGRLLSKRTVVSTHAVYNLKERRFLALLVKWLLSSFNSILAVGSASEEELVKAGLDKEKIKIHPNWVDLDIFHPHDKKMSRISLGLPEDKFIILFVGRLIAKKGILTLIDVARKVPDDIVFVIVGAGGPESDRVVEAGRELTNLIFIDHLPSSEEHKQQVLTKYYSSADIFILPSQYEEGFASVIPEGIACGTPIIATNKGCIPQIVDETVGVLLDPTELNIKETIVYFYNHPKELTQKAINCRRYALDHFDESNAEVIYKSYVK